MQISLGQISVPDSLKAFRVQQPIKLDGKLDEAVWKKALPISNFTQRELREGDTATQPTRVAVLYDDENLYIGAWCFDNQPDKLTASRMQRDFDYWTDDNFELIVDTYGDKRNGYLFVTNPNAARSDAMISRNGSAVNRAWDGVWNVKVQKTAWGWSAEFKIPFATLKFRKQQEQHWGINFERNIRRIREQDLWQGWSRDADLEQVSRAGNLTGIKNISNTSLIEMKPYAIGGIEIPRSEKTNWLGNLGGDVNFLIRPTLKLNLTVNTDFAQVESDAMQVNLTRFSLYYPEKREFFLEGKDYFKFGLGYSMQPFYSRRIGLAPDRHIVPIYGGARIMGKEGNASLGAMSLQTAPKDSTPTTNYSVVRWKQDILKESSVGIIAVSKLQPGRQNFVYGADFTYFNSHFRNDKNISFGGAVSQSYTSDFEKQTGLASRIFFDYPNDFIDFSAIWDRAAEGFNPEVGFMRRRNYQMFNADFRLKPRPKKSGFIRQYVFKPFDFNYYIDDRTHQLQSLWSEFRPLGFITKSGEQFEFNIQRKAENLTTDFEIHEHVVIPKGEYWFTDFELQLETFQGRQLYGAVFVNWGGFYDGKQSIYKGELTWQASRFIKFSGQYSRYDIRLPEGDFVVHQFGGRADFAVNPDLFGSLFGQWNNEEKVVLLNFRVNWIPTPGTNFYFVVNQGYDTQTNRLTLEYTTIQAKLIWRFVL
ncbi:MAG: carbohydrate binding family 9 domain-containing protein [Bacteroidales bacterium]|nr:carbohydrate binding family 9 domain-containing protein [Bacteroidales bacterium]